MTHPIEFRLVRRADLRQRRLLWLLLICATGLSLAFVLLRAPLPFGFWVGMPIPDRDDRAVSAELAALRAERDALVGRVARAERSAQVEQESSTRIRLRLVELRNELQALREEVAFYRGIVAPGEAAAKLRIKSFALRLDEADARPRYEFILARGQPDEKYVEGKVELRLVAERSGDAGSGSGEGSSAPLLERPYRFRYFQRFSGEFDLPPDAAPQRVLVRVIPSGKGVAPLEQAYPWVREPGTGGTPTSRARGE